LKSRVASVTLSRQVPFQFSIFNFRTSDHIETELTARAYASREASRWRRVISIFNFQFSILELLIHIETELAVGAYASREVSRWRCVISIFNFQFSILAATTILNPANPFADQSIRPD
jgi:hypothetical protein